MTVAAIGEQRSAIGVRRSSLVVFRSLLVCSFAGLIVCSLLVVSWSLRLARRFLPLARLSADYVIHDEKGVHLLSHMFHNKRGIGERMPAQDASGFHNDRTPTTTVTKEPAAGVAKESPSEEGKREGSNARGKQKVKDHLHVHMWGPDRVKDPSLCM